MQGELQGNFVEGLRALRRCGRAQHVANFCAAPQLRCRKPLRTRTPILLYLASPAAWATLCQGGSDHPPPHPTPPLCRAGVCSTAAAAPPHAAHSCNNSASTQPGGRDRCPPSTRAHGSHARRSTFQSTPGARLLPQPAARALSCSHDQAGILVRDQLSSVLCCSSRRKYVRFGGCGGDTSWCVPRGVCTAPLDSSSFAACSRQAGCHALAARAAVRQCSVCFAVLRRSHDSMVGSGSIHGVLWLELTQQAPCQPELHFAACAQAHKPWLCKSLMQQVLPRHTGWHGCQLSLAPARGLVL
jgi:hypothetical protein